MKVKANVNLYSYPHTRYKKTGLGVYYGHLSALQPALSRSRAWGVYSPAHRDGSTWVKYRSSRVAVQRRTAGCTMVYYNTPMSSLDPGFPLCTGSVPFQFPDGLLPPTPHTLLCNSFTEI